MAVTVQDVALSAGVSPATVSRVLNKRQEISPHSRQVVEKAIIQLGYPRGRTRRGRSVSVKRPVSAGTLALLIPDTHIEAMLTPLMGQIMHGAEVVARREGFRFQMPRLAVGTDCPRHWRQSTWTGFSCVAAATRPSGCNRSRIAAPITSILLLPSVFNRWPSARIGGLNRSATIAGK